MGLLFYFLSLVTEKVLNEVIRETISLKERRAANTARFAQSYGARLDCVFWLLLLRWWWNQPLPRELTRPLCWEILSKDFLPGEENGTKTAEQRRHCSWPWRNLPAPLWPGLVSGPNEGVFSYRAAIWQKIGCIFRVHCKSHFSAHGASQDTKLCKVRRV